jgi:peptidoglycan biosynthesis protein MviN/MurJ (putative lipid II flippase)
MIRDVPIWETALASLCVFVALVTWWQVRKKQSEGRSLAELVGRRFEYFLFSIVFCAASYGVGILAVLGAIQNLSRWEGVAMGAAFVAIGTYFARKIRIGLKHRRDPSFFELNRYRDE